MKIIVDQEASDYLFALCDNFLKTQGVKGLEIVNKVLQNTKTDENVDDAKTKNATD